MAAALAFRDGLMIALLASRPLRRRNFLGIEIGRQLVRERGGWLLRFAAAEMKNHQRLEFVFPRALEGALVRYLDHWRPRIIEVSQRRRPKMAPQGRPAGSHLWVTMEGGALGAAGLRKVLCGRTLQRFGVAVTAHLFRDCAATSIAAQDPDHVRIAAQLLGHASLQTTERYYVIANNRASMGKHQDRIRALRRGDQGGRRGNAPRQ
jgi:site-specific recombinase XerD